MWCLSFSTSHWHYVTEREVIFTTKILELYQVVTISNKNLYNKYRHNKTIYLISSNIFQVRFKFHDAHLNFRFYKDHRNCSSSEIEMNDWHRNFQSIVFKYKSQYIQNFN